MLYRYMYCNRWLKANVGKSAMIAFSKDRWKWREHELPKVSSGIDFADRSNEAWDLLNDDRKMA